jgi:putative endopeptidase
LANNTIPSDRSSWARSFSVLSQQVEALELTIDNDSFPLIGPFFKSCLNTTRMDLRGGVPLQPMLQLITSVNASDSATLTQALGALWNDGSDALFSFGPSPDDMNPLMTVATFDQGGTTLPQSFYDGNDSNSVGARAALVTFASTLFALLPAPFNATPAASGASVLSIESALANISMTNTQQRNPYAVYNMIGLPALQALSKSVNYTQFLETIGVDVASMNTSMVNVRSVPFYGALDSIVQNLTTSDLQSYLAFRFVAQQASLLSEPFRNASFAMLQALTGVAALPAREVQCVRAIDTTDLGFAVGHQFIAQYFEPSVKVAAQVITECACAYLSV